MFLMFDDVHPLLTTTQNSNQYAKLAEEKVVHSIMYPLYHKGCGGSGHFL
jgi:hypothetical protein